MPGKEQRQLNDLLVCLYLKEREIDTVRVWNEVSFKVPSNSRHSVKYNSYEGKKKLQSFLK